MRRIVLAVPVMAFVLAGSTACATKKFVNTRVGEVNTKVDSLGRTVEETQERTRSNEGRISEVDQKAAAANNAAMEASSAANAVNGRVDTLDGAGAYPATGQSRPRERLGRPVRLAPGSHCVVSV